jgi:D-alanine-D-alanine ligase
MGGMAAEREVSLKTGRAVLQALRRRNVPAVGVTLDSEDLSQLPRNLSVAFLALHGGFGEDGRLQAMLDDAGIPYTGSGPAASATCMDKIATRAALRAAGIRVAEGLPLSPGAAPETVLETIGLPAVVKPRAEGSSFGVAIVRRPTELLAALDNAWKFGEAALVERFVGGTELTVAVLEGKALAPVEMLPSDEFFTYDAKYGGGTVYVVDPPMSPGVRAEVQRVGEAAYRALGCRHYARVDVILRNDGCPVVLEVNTLPGMTSTSLFPMAAQKAGMSFEDLCMRFLHLAERESRSRRLGAA